MHDHFADFGGGEFALRGFVDHAFDFVDDGFEFRRGDRAFLAGFQKSLQNFLAFEALAAAILLDDHVGNFVDAFVGGEAAGTFQAFAAAADGVAGAALARVNYLVIDDARRKGTSLEGFSIGNSRAIVRHGRQGGQWRGWGYSGERAWLRDMQWSVIRDQEAATMSTRDSRRCVCWSRREDLATIPPLRVG